MESDKRCTKCGGPGPFSKNSNVKSGFSSECKQCEKARKAIYYAKNKEKILAKQHTPEAKARIVAHHAEYYTRPEIIDRETSRRKAYYKKNQTKIKKYAKVWKSENRERAAKNMRRWNQSNPVRAALLKQRRLERFRSLPATLTQREWEETLEYFDHSCAYCLRKVASLHQEHIIPVVDGGGYTADNIVPACGQCNHIKGPRPIFFMLNR